MCRDHGRLGESVNEVDRRDLPSNAIGEVNHCEASSGAERESGGLRGPHPTAAPRDEAESDSGCDHSDGLRQPEVVLSARDGLEAAAVNERPEAGREVVGALDPAHAAIEMRRSVARSEQAQPSAFTPE